MASNLINDETIITQSSVCIYDSNIGYFSDFSVNGEVDGWTYYDGIHTYGAWDGFLFGTVYDSYCTVGRHTVFQPVDATDYYFLKIVMKYDCISREGIHVNPSQGKVRWRTIADSDWTSAKESFFEINPNGEWNVYLLNMGPEQWWQGDINDLRIWPVVRDAVDGDTFFIKSIELSSVDSYKCYNVSCDKYLMYEHPCPWIGQRAYCESGSHDSNMFFSIENDTEFIININDYGDEIVKIPEVLNASGDVIANTLAKCISKVDVGGYAEVHVVYTDDNKFKIYSGTRTEDSTIKVIDNSLSRYLNFFNRESVDVSNKTSGVLPANGYSPVSSFKIKTHQLLSLFSVSNEAQLYFDPSIYNIEAGRRDWLESGIGFDNFNSNSATRSYQLLYNNGRTVIDFNHPFNASGRITKIVAACTLDMVFDRPTYNERMRVPNDQYDENLQELSGAKIMIFRPRKDGTTDVIHEFDIPSRDPDRDYYEKLYSLTQEVVDLDVDIFVNKGDLLGIYNANLYVGKSSAHNQDCQYFQVIGKPSGNFDVGSLYGDGIAGILMYARGDEKQTRLVLDVDLKHRYNIENIEIKGKSESVLLEYNIARCLDINWEVELFDHYHITAHKKTTQPGDFRYQRYNVAYGIDNLSDGELTVPDGLACDGYSLTMDNSIYNWNADAGPGVVPVNPKYFWVNGDQEWLAVWLHASIYQYQQEVYDFEEDPIVIFLHFPHQKEKIIYKSKIYFKERNNFRSFALSTYRGMYDMYGNADDPHYELIPAYTSISLDNTEYEPGSYNYYRINEYLYKNPCVGAPVVETTGEAFYDWDPILSDAIRDFSTDGESGYFVTQNAVVTNTDEWQQSMTTDWQIIEHEWEPVAGKGFRIFTDYHKSTKICEMELYGVGQDIGSSLGGGVSIIYSDYLDVWWPTESVQVNEELVEVYLGDTPRYFSIQFSPIGVTRYDNIILNVKTEDTYAGKKGCEYINYIEHSKMGADNESQLIEIKNDYRDDYDLYVDISANDLVTNGFIFYSKLNDLESITNPVIGPDAHYTKKYDYAIKNDDYNCAINCDVYGLVNLIEGKNAYYSNDGLVTWNSFAQLKSDEIVNFHNLTTTTMTTVVLPTLSRNRYWKFGFKCNDVVIPIRELNVFDGNNNLYQSPSIYHDVGKTYEEGNVAYKAPHLNNTSVVGSYYNLTENQYITVDLSDVNVLKKIKLIHDSVDDYTLRTPGEPDSDIIAGIDKYTKLCLRPWVDNTGWHLDDLSYYEHPIEVYGTAAVVDSSVSGTSINNDVSFNCLTDWADWFIMDTFIDDNPTLTTSGTVVSGTCISGSGYFDFDLACSNRSSDGLFYDLKEDSVSWPLYQNVPFEIKFKIRFDSTVMQEHNYDWPPVDTTCCVGMFADKIEENYGAVAPYFPGPQMVFKPGDGTVGIAVKEYSSINRSVLSDIEEYQSSVTSLGIEYYCKFSSSGSSTNKDGEDITYSAKIWTDAWDGSQKILDISVTSSIMWDIWRTGLASCYGSDKDLEWGLYTFLEPGYIRGVISDFQLTVNHEINNYPFDKEVVGNTNAVSLRLPAGEENYVSVPTHLELDFGKKRHTIDFWVKFNTLPANGNFFTLLEGVTDTDGNCWSIRLHNTGIEYRLEWWQYDGTGNHLVRYNGWEDSYGSIPNCKFTTNRWYYLLFSTGKSLSPQGFPAYGFFDINGRAIYDHAAYYHQANIYDIFAGGNINIGKNFDGWVTEVRISRGNHDTIDTDYGFGGNRINRGGTSFASRRLQYGVRLPVPVKPYEKLYTFSIYVSDDNISFGHYADVDAVFDDSYSYFVTGSLYAEKYMSYLAIDLTKPHYLDTLRHYGADNLYYFTNDTNMIFSNIDTDDPLEAFGTEFSLDPDDSFEGWDSELPDPDKWMIDGLDVLPTDYLRLCNGYLESKADINNDSHTFKTKYSIQGDFDIEVKMGRTAATLDVNSWKSIFRLDFSNGESGPTYIEVSMEYDYDNPSPYYYMKAVFVDDGYEMIHFFSLEQLHNSGVRVVREHTHFVCYYYDNVWLPLTDNYLHNSVGKGVLAVKMGTSVGVDKPTVVNYYKDFKVNNAEKLLVRSDYSDARWLAVELLNGDGFDRYIEKIGVYPDITKNIVNRGNDYNCDWTSLGYSVTGYSDSPNLALGTTVSGSSYVEGYYLEHTVDGIKGDDFRDVWATDSADEQWLLIDLGEEKNVNKVKLFHGYSEIDDRYMINDYEIQVSTDNISFTTVFEIDENTSFERTHDLLEPVSARYVRLYIIKYVTDWRDLRLADGSYERFEGALLREIEVYADESVSIVSSEEYPIIAINLRDQFYINEHSLEGVHTEYDYFDWNNDDSNFAYSDDVCDEPQKVVFSEFGIVPNYEQWVIVKRNTASYYNTPAEEFDTGGNYVPADNYGIDYLKHVVIKSTEKLNPVDYYWWWDSIISDLSNSYKKQTEVCERSLRIDYPASTALDGVKFSGGSNFGVDVAMSYRDGVAFSWYIDDINKLDMNEGYFFFGGEDGTQETNPLEYRWNLSSISGSLQTGWNKPFFRFNFADDVIYTLPSDSSDIVNPLMREYMTMKTVGLKFRGIGQPFGMNIDGFVIQRNHFNDYAKFDRGLYLAGDDHLTFPLGEMFLSSGTVEFWFRPDYNFFGKDECGKHKNRSLFSFNNVANDVFGMVITKIGVIIYFGNINTDLNVYVIDSLSVDSRDKLYHIGVVFSNNGKHLANSNSTIRLYINNFLIVDIHKQWEVTDNKFFKFMMGGKIPDCLVQYSRIKDVTSVDAVISDLKLYNYCKTDFTDSMSGALTDEQITEIISSDKLIEISSNNLTYYKVRAQELPLFFEKVVAGASVPIYVKSIVPDNLTSVSSRTSSIKYGWEVGV